MNRRKTIYRGFNKRRKNKSFGKVLFIGFLIGILYLYNKVDLESLKTNISSNNTDIKKEFEYNDIKDEVNKLNEDKKDEKTEKNEDVNVANINEWTFYTVQVASIEDINEVKNIEKNLADKKIPFATVNIDNINKVQTYSFFDKEVTRKYLNELRVDYPDAFLAEVKIPALSLEYTKKYNYIEKVSSSLNNLIENFKNESSFWASENVDLTKYKEILDSRSNIVAEIEKETKNIDYEESKIFRDNLLEYTKSIKENITVSSKSANEQDLSKSKSLFLDSMQGYLEFIYSLK